MEQKGTFLYKDQFSEREYSIMLEREQQGKTFEYIGKLHGISDSRASQIYGKAKRKQLLLYLQAIGIAEGYTRYNVKGNANYLSEKYGSNAWAVAFLEDRYANILTEFRNGEPPSPYIFHGINPEYNRQPTVKQVSDDSLIRESDRSTHEIEPSKKYETCIYLYRTKLHEFELLVLREKGKKLQGYKEVAEQLSITKELARSTYYSARIIQLHIKFAVIKEKTGKTFEDLHSEIEKQNISIFHLTKVFQYIDKTYGDILATNEDNQI